MLYYLHMYVSFSIRVHSGTIGREKEGSESTAPRHDEPSVTSAWAAQLRRPCVALPAENIPSRHALVCECLQPVIVRKARRLTCMVSCQPRSLAAPDFDPCVRAAHMRAYAGCMTSRMHDRGRHAYICPFQANEGWSEVAVIESRKSTAVSTPHQGLTVARPMGPRQGLQLQCRSAAGRSTERVRARESA